MNRDEYPHSDAHGQTTDFGDGSLNSLHRSPSHDTTPIPDPYSEEPELQSQPSNLDDATAEIQLSTQTSTMRRAFCPTCGSPWPLDTDACQNCSEAKTWQPVDHAAVESPIRPVVSASALYFVILAANILFAIFGYVVGNGEDDAVFVYSIIFTSIVDSLIILIWSCVTLKDIKPCLTHLSSLRWYVAAVAIAPITFILATVICNFSENTLELENINYTKPFLDNGYSFVTVILLICVQPAIFEELAFRGIVIGALSRIMQQREVLIVSSALFMLLHLSLISFPHLFVIGLALGYLRLRTGSLYPGVLLHFTHNFFVVWYEYARV